jgi:hypothetical protein
MKIGLIGCQNSGKTTIFNALTRSEAEVADFSNAKAEPNLAVIEVEDERVTRLSEMYRPRKTIYGTVEFTDFVGVAGGPEKQGAFSPELLQLAKNTDALALVARNFNSEIMGPPAPVEDVAKVGEELVFSDLIVVENRLERIAWENKKGKKSNQTLAEEALLEKILEQLNDNQPIRRMVLTDEEDKLLKGYQFLSRKPLMVILNSEEENFGRNDEVLARLQEDYSVVEFAGNFEMELSRMASEEDIQLFMDDLGIEESARSLLTRTAYELLGYISFFTVGPDEVRAWNLRRGENAVAAAGTIHSDLARGFIRAECFSYDDLMACGSEKGVKEKGLLRLEGKEYKVKDGDILNIRFNV